MATCKDLNNLAKRLDGNMFMTVNSDGEVVYICKFAGRKIESPNRDWLASELRREVEIKYYG